MLYKLGGSSFLPALPSARVSPRASSMPLTPRPSPPYYPGRAHQASPRSQTPRTSRVRALEVEVKHLRVAAFQSHTKAKFWESAAARARAAAEAARPVKLHARGNEKLGDLDCVWLPRGEGLKHAARGRKIVQIVW